MKTICRLNWFGIKDYNEFYSIAAEIEIFLRESGKLNKHFSIGNFCINGIPTEIAQEFKNKYNAHSIDNYKDILEIDDIRNLKIGDKVKIFFNNTWAQYSEDKGTVYAIENDSVVIKKYRSKTKGYILRAGEIGRIEKGW